MDELRVACIIVKVLPTLVVVGILLHLLVDEYLRQMELRGLVRRRSVQPPVEESGEEPVTEDRPRR